MKNTFLLLFFLAFTLSLSAQSQLDTKKLSLTEEAQFTKADLSDTGTYEFDLRDFDFPNAQREKEVMNFLKEKSMFQVDEKNKKFTFQVPEDYLHHQEMSQEEIQLRLLKKIQMRLTQMAKRTE